MVAGVCLWLLGRSGRLSLPVIALVEWLTVVVHGCLGSMVTCRRLWLLGLNGSQLIGQACFIVQH